MRIIAACEDSGSLKEIVCSQKTDTSVQTAPQPESIETFVEEGLRNRVQQLLVISTENGQVVVAARAGGNISLYKIGTYDLINTVTDGLVSDSKDKDQFIALIESFGVIYAVSEQGRVTLINTTTVFDEKVITASTTLKAPISAFTAHPEQEGIFAYGGKENDVKVVRLFKRGQEAFTKKLSPEQLFEAKNVKNDKLDLRVPIWITNILFVRLSLHTFESWHFITTTRYGQVRRYDTTHGRKPLMEKKLSDKPLVQISKTKNEEEIICADTYNTTSLFDIEKGNLVAKYKGSVGAVQGLFSTLGKVSLLATGALDRYVRVFNIDTREQLAKVYVGAKVSAVWMLDDDLGSLPVGEVDKKAEKRNKAKKAREELENEDVDKVWDDLDNLEKRAKKRKTDE